MTELDNLERKAYRAEIEELKCHIKDLEYQRKMLEEKYTRKSSLYKLIRNAAMMLLGLMAIAFMAAMIIFAIEANLVAVVGMVIGLLSELFLVNVFEIQRLKNKLEQ